MNRLGTRALPVVLSMRRDEEGMLPGRVADSFTTLFSSVSWSSRALNFPR